MSPTTSEIAEAFSRHRFEETYPFMLDDAEWTLVGAEQVRGKADIVRVCQESASDLENTTTSFSGFKVISTDDRVVIDSRAEYVDGNGESSHVASCDIYEFTDGNIAAITSYAVEVEPRTD
jgi:ketosteroid isomerase-like protein